MQEFNILLMLFVGTSLGPSAALAHYIAERRGLCETWRYAVLSMTTVVATISANLFWPEDG
ncbi:hypothetical protein [Gymnodinialimonas ulvae]|uniref:hypothetical protein n=1 Tax=Gymnodinialimonas ulvae TaxID=3126504 RepID=UPI0030B49B43